MRYTPTEALKLLNGITRKRLYEMMKNGYISYSQEEKKRYIDGSELARVFGDKFRPIENKKTFQKEEMKQSETQETTTENRLLQQKIEFLQERISDKERENEKLWERLKTETEERQRLVMVLTDMRNSNDTKAENQKPWWKFWET